MGLVSLGSGVINHVYINNCYLSNKITLTEHTEGNGIDTPLRGGGNSVVNVEVVSGFENMTKYFCK